MPGRGPQTFKKRQKEQQRKEKQQEKMERRLARKHERGNPSESGEDGDIENMPIQTDLEPESEVTERSATAAGVGD